jgi:hypothetical protein
MMAKLSHGLISELVKEMMAVMITWEGLPLLLAAARSSVHSGAHTSLPMLSAAESVWLGSNTPGSGSSSSSGGSSEVKQTNDCVQGDSP